MLLTDYLSDENYRLYGIAFINDGRPAKNWTGFIIYYYLLLLFTYYLPITYYLYFKMNQNQKAQIDEFASTI